MNGKNHATPDSQRFTADEIFHNALENARGELGRSATKLVFSGIAGGLTMGLSALGMASCRALLGEEGSPGLVSYLFYPIGFIAVIIGREQLFTENTLYPVVLVLDERRHLLSMLRLWGLVFFANVLGAWAFGVLATRTTALHPDIVSQLVTMGAKSATGDLAHLFWSGVIGGWLIALVAWTVTASHWTIGQLAMIYILTFLVGIGRFDHCIASSCEILSAVASGAVPVGRFFQWLWPTTLGNICGGVVIVSLLNYGQVRAI